MSRRHQAHGPCCPGQRSWFPQYLEVLAGDPNGPFEPSATPYDWLSRDAAEVRKYIDDPWSGFEVAFEVPLLLDLADAPQPSVPPDLPVLVLNGSQDAVGGFSGGGAALATAYEELGLADVTYLGYEGGRHELFNETNRDEVLADLVAWLEPRFTTVALTISTAPGSPLFGGGTSNVAFLLGNPTASAPNAQAVNMEATFWIETVEYTIQVPVFQPGQPPLTIAAEAGTAGPPGPDFLVNPPVAITAPRTIKATATQIQYAQQVFLNFNGLTWPHVSVATLVPATPVPVPASAFA
jgi:Serine aminopeptidase, S33